MNLGGEGKVLKNDPSLRRPVPATTDENTDRVHYMVMDDRKVTINQIANTVSIFCEGVEHILHNELA